MSNTAAAQPARTITMELPESLYLWLQQTTRATRQSVEATVLRALQVGSLPSWETAALFQLKNGLVLV